MKMEGPLDEKEVDIYILQLNSYSYTNFTAKKFDWPAS